MKNKIRLENRSEIKTFKNDLVFLTPFASFNFENMVGRLEFSFNLAFLNLYLGIFLVVAKSDRTLGKR